MSKRIVNKKSFKTFDGTNLVYRSWSPKQEETSAKKKALIVIHRGHEHSGRLDDLIEGMNCDDFWAFGYDGRGHGESPGPRGYADDFSHLVKDLDTFVKYIGEKYDIAVEDMMVVANSVGAVIASTWVHDYAPCIRGMVLAAPAFKVKLYVPFALPSLRVLNMFKKPAFISSYVKSMFLTHDKEQQRLYDSDKLITPQIAVNILVGLYDAANRVVQDAGAIHVPTLVLSAEKDFVVDNKIQRRFFDGLSSVNKKFVTLKGFYHGVLYEQNRQQAFSECNTFINQCYAQEPKIVSLTNAHKGGYTYNEYENLIFKHTGIVNGFMFWFQRMMMSILGWTSKGIRVGLKHGFDSGLSLDHVYENKATGFSFIGRIIDYFYINAVGWKGIRQRKVNLQGSLDGVIEKLANDGKPIRIMDIAAGPGRYLIETAKRHEDKDLEVLVRDYAEANISQGRNLAKNLHCKNVDFKVSDAFNKDTFTEQKFKPNVLIVSGLYELFPNNDDVQKSIEGACSILDDDGYIIYTGQPWHPQLEMIAQTLPNREGKKWIMRRRTQREIDQLFAAAGAQKKDMSIDEWGIFTVSTAEFKRKQTEQKAG
jgi:alpha-beta hydrolase superfamily lysophospholipase/SAM-dependent methyltransferase